METLWHLKKKTIKDENEIKYLSDEIDQILLLKTSHWVFYNIY